MTEVSVDYLQQQKILVCTPCYGGTVHNGYLQSMWDLVNASYQIGISVGLHTVNGESLVTRARNYLVSNFLKSNATHLMFIDADITFNPFDVFRMLSMDKDIIVGSYPLKNIAMGKLAKAFKEEKLDLENLSQFERYASHYVVHTHRPSVENIGKNNEVDVVEGLIEVYEAGTGFMLIKRKVFLKLIEAYPEMEYLDDRDYTLPEEERKMYSFFDTQVDEHKRYLSEDYDFCKKWRDIGGKIHLATSVVLDHSGTYTFKGRNLFE